MKIPYFYDCAECSRRRTRWTHICSNYVNHNCVCGYKTQVMIRSSITTGTKLLYRAGFEIEKRNDYQAGIIIAVMAFESEQLRLYKKWHSLDQVEHVEPNVIHDYVVKIFRKSDGVREKVNRTIRKGMNMCFNEYIHGETSFAKSMRKVYPEFNERDPFNKFHELLFEPRNNIIHGGNYMQTKNEARIVYNIARNGIKLLRLIDQERGSKRFKIYKGIQ